MRKDPCKSAPVRVINQQNGPSNHESNVPRCTGTAIPVFDYSWNETDRAQCIERNGSRPHGAWPKCTDGTRIFVDNQGPNSKKRFSADEARKCLSGHSLMFMGDSVTRYAMCVLRVLCAVTLLSSMSSCCVAVCAVWQCVLTVLCGSVCCVAVCAVCALCVLWKLNRNCWQSLLQQCCSTAATKNLCGLILGNTHQGYFHPSILVFPTLQSVSQSYLLRYTRSVASRSRGI